MSVEWILRSRQRRVPANPEWIFHGWYYKCEGCWTGPVSIEELAQLRRKKQLQPSDKVMEVWKNGDRTRCAYREAAAVLARPLARVPSCHGGAGKRRAGDCACAKRKRDVLGCLNLENYM